MPATDFLLRSHGYGPDIQFFVMSYPAYFPKNAGKAFNALYSRLKSVEKHYLQEEKKRLPSFASVEIGSEPVVFHDISIFRNSLFNHISLLMSGRSHSTLKEQVSPLVNGTASPDDVQIPKRNTLHRTTSRILNGLDQKSPIMNKRRMNTKIDANGRLTAPVGIDAVFRYEGFDRYSSGNYNYERRVLHYTLPCFTTPNKDKKIVINELGNNEGNPNCFGLLRRFRLGSGQEIAHSGSINDVCFSMSERRVASASSDNTIKLWDPLDGSFIKSFKQHTKEVTSIIFSNDELFLLSGGADGLIFIWDMIENVVVRSLRGHSDCIYSLAAMHDVSIIYSASHDKTIKTWHLNPQKPNHPTAPRAVGTTDTSILISWKAPPSFNESITAFHLQYRVGLRNPWMPGANIKLRSIMNFILMGSL